MAREPTMLRAPIVAEPKRPPIVLLVIAALLVVGIGAGLWRYSRFNTVYAINGLQATVDVTLAGQTFQVPPDGRVHFSDVPVGTHVIVTRLKGQELESTLVFVKGGGHDLV